MSIILYAITEDNAFCKKNTTDNLDWMRVSSDRQLFKFITTLFPNIPIIVGRKTKELMPELKGRKVIVASKTFNNNLYNIFNQNNEFIVIGGYIIIKDIIEDENLRQAISKIITIRLPITTNNINEYLTDPLLKYKENNDLILKNKFQFKGNKLNDKFIQIEEWTKF